MALLKLSDRDLSHSEMVIHTLYEITSHYEAGLQQQTRELLEMGCVRFEMEIGILSRVEGEAYEIIEAVAPEGVVISAGDRLDLGSTFCSLSVAADAPWGIVHAGQEIPTHAAYEAQGLEAYIGTPLHIDGELFGTLSFARALPREHAFTDVDVDCLMLMDSWLETEIQRRRAEDALEEATRRLQQLVITDPLTELANRRGIVEELTSFARRTEADGATLSCILIDIDDFKQVNDRFGHSTGDRVIQAVADALRTVLRPGDVAGRVGGDEFLILLPGADTGEARLVAARVGAAIRELEIADEEEPVPVTVSIGVADVSGGASSVTEVLRQTEALLKASKASGKDKVSG